MPNIFDEEMFHLPTFTITHLILDYIVKSEHAARTINSTPLPYRFSAEIYTDNHAEELQNISELVGNPLGYNKALAIQKGKENLGPRSQHKVFSNYRSVHEFIKSYSSKNFLPISSALMIHMNKLLLNGTIDAWELGKIRDFSDRPNEIYDTWYKYRDFYPQLNQIEHFDEIFDWIAKPKITIHKLIQVAILAYELIDKAPFQAGNQMTSILTLAVVTKEYGYNPENMLSFAKAINLINSDLLVAFKMSKSKKDLTAFMEAFLYTFSLEIRNTANTYETILKTKVKKQANLGEKFNPRQIKVLEYLEQNKRITRNEYAKLMGISFMTAFRDLSSMLEEGFVQQKGVGRGTYYVLAKSIESEDSQAFDQEKTPIFGD